ncbi:MAG: RNA polymerase sigma-70 factor [Bacteroidales bacterium]|nr:RNA polymerase sigma-70 factor [Bacteroidales bacterium]
MTDNEFITKLNNGDLTAFRQLYSEYYIPLCVYADHFTKRKEIAEEIVQDVFLNIWEQKGQLRIITSLKAYLFTSIRNQCLNHLKHLQVVMEYNDYYTQLLKDAQDYYIISQESGDSIMIANELEQSLKEAIDLLPDGCRKIFIMSRFDGLRHKDIADKLGITLNTVDKQISIALGKLKESLKFLIVTLLFVIFYSILF